MLSKKADDSVVFRASTLLQDLESCFVGCKPDFNFVAKTRTLKRHLHFYVDESGSATGKKTLISVRGSSVGGEIRIPSFRVETEVDDG